MLDLSSETRKEEGNGMSGCQQDQALYPGLTFAMGERPPCSFMVWQRKGLNCSWVLISNTA